MTDRTFINGEQRDSIRTKLNAVITEADALLDAGHTAANLSAKFAGYDAAGSTVTGAAIAAALAQLGAGAKVDVLNDLLSAFGFAGGQNLRLNADGELEAQAEVPFRYATVAELKAGTADRVISPSVWKTAHNWQLGSIAANTIDPSAVATASFSYRYTDAGGVTLAISDNAYNVLGPDGYLFVEVAMAAANASEITPPAAATYVGANEPGTYAVNSAIWRFMFFQDNTAAKKFSVLRMNP